jgi:hypothetical protein
MVLGSVTEDLRPHTRHFQCPDFGAVLFGDIVIGPWDSLSMSSDSWCDICIISLVPHKMTG